MMVNDSGDILVRFNNVFKIFSVYSVFGEIFHTGILFSKVEHELLVAIKILKTYFVDLTDI